MNQQHSTTTPVVNMLNCAALSLDQALPGDICGLRGDVLLRCGDILTQTDLDCILKEHAGCVFAGDNWVNPPCLEVVENSAVLEAVRRIRHGYEGKSLRRHKRHKLRMSIKVELEDRNQSGVSSGAIEVMMLDISAGGFGFTHQHYIKPGTRLWTQFHSLPTRPSIFGISRHCVRAGDRSFKTGVEFLRVYRGTDLYGKSR